MRKYNTQNLTFGGRRLRFSAKLANMDEVERELLQVVQNFSKSVKNEAMNDAVVMLEERAVHYIREGKKASGIASKLGGVHPRSQGLEHSFRYSIDETDKAKVSMGDNVVYAKLHNQPEGHTTTIVPQHGEFLLFRWFKLEIKSRIAARSVERPGVAYWDRALDDVDAAMKKIVAKSLRTVIKAGGVNVSPTTGAQLRGRPRLKNNAKSRSRRSR